jgi:hypothetical protein
MQLTIKRRGLRKSCRLAWMTILWLGVAAHAQRSEAPQRANVVHPLGPAIAATGEGTLLSIAALRALGDGNLFVNDVVKRRVLMLDSNLVIRKVVADTSNLTRRLYGSAATGLFAFRADSTLFLDGSALSMVVLDATGTMRGVRAPPRASDFGQLVGGAAGSPGFDAAGRLIYHAPGVALSELVKRGRTLKSGKVDTTALLRFDFGTRRLDTVTMLQTYQPSVREITTGDNGAMSVWFVPILHPAPIVDDWAVTPNGKIAILRGRDYHVDIFDALSPMKSGPKLPFKWRRLSDEDKRLLIDSSRALRERLIAQGVRAPSDFAPLPGSEPISRATISIVDGRARPTTETSLPPEVIYVAPSDLPDYQPAFATGALRADAQGRLWIRTIATTPLSGGAIYDVLDGTGELVDRVQVPRGSTIAGFGNGGTVYLAVHDANGVRLERHRY